MRFYSKPQFIIKANLQKSTQTGVYFSDQISHHILDDICLKITGLKEYDYKFVDNEYEDDFLQKGYNKGRLAILLYRDTVNFISFSERNIGGRNSSVQSVPTAYNLFFLFNHLKKRLYYYFLNDSGNAETDYQFLIYRLMETLGFIFLNSRQQLSQIIHPFVSIEDIMFSRNEISDKNKGNHSTYITKNSNNQFDIYGKTYGANKYETSLMTYTLSKLAMPNQNIVLYEMLEGDLHELPTSSLNVIKNMPNVSVIKTDREIEIQNFEKENSLRSPQYIFHLLERLGNKHCALCDCEIPELIQGAHIWPVANIKRQNLPYDEKIKHATSGHNGLWLCENHHKMFDENIIKIDENGSILLNSSLSERHYNFVDSITTYKELPDCFLSEEFIHYVHLRNLIA